VLGTPSSASSDGSHHAGPGLTVWICSVRGTGPVTGTPAGHRPAQPAPPGAPQASAAAGVCASHDRRTLNALHTLVYRQLGLRLTYDHETRMVLVETRPTPLMCVVKVSEGFVHTKNTPAAAA
jgi:hypothetical protein